jgi:dihydroorotate dehydrogenase electron transfer subunit
MPLHNPGREEKVLERLRRLSDGSMPAGAIDRIYRVIMQETLNLQTARRSDGACPGHAAKRDVEAVVADNVPVAPGSYRMRVRGPGLAGAFTPGQFFQIRIEDGADGLFLRRPFAPSAYTGDGLEFVYAVVGAGTRRLAALKAGAAVRVLAPLGNAFTPAPSGSRAVLLGGGLGAPSLAPLAGMLREGGAAVSVFLGARSAELLLEQEAFARACDRLVLATDDGSRGWRGTGVEAFRAHRAECGRIDRMYAIGPVPMLRAVAALAAEEGIACEVSLEERMACGFGACMGCAVPVRSEAGSGSSVFRRVCHDGPVFDAATLAWEEII